ncbi:MAG: GIY-YIG nuclease family protein [Spirochaetaceae bacterium]|nr:GIY-YIG nuclease family protein [Spirochaetaceae bacterium]MCF7947178.1 GIY-YIG nuclease family protein [Spirochaetia bacterium]MCF7950043.1 GIY-YIG nuclease family protein [Spirochaetaceae bacterium]
MAEQSYKIDFDGYWREPNKKGVPSKSGIYCVYACTHNSQEKTVSIRKLIYIGESDNVVARIADHEKQSDWESHLKSVEQLCYSFGPVNRASRERCEAALIFKHKPPENIEYINSFPYDRTTMNLRGKIALLDPSFAV